MSKMRALLSLYFKQNSAITEMVYKAKKGVVGPVIISFLKLLLKIAFGIGFFIMGLGIALISQFLGAPQVGVQLGFLIVTIFMLFEGFTIFYNLFVEDKTLLMVIPMPIKVGTVINSKFLYAFIVLFLSNLLFILPIIFTYGIFNGSLFFWIVALSSLFLLPALILCLVGFIIFFVGGILSRKGARGILAFFGSMLILVFSFSLSFLSSRMSTASFDAASVDGIWNTIEGGLNYTGVYPITGSVFFGEPWRFLIFLVASLLIIALFLKFAASQYYKKFIVLKLESNKGSKKRKKMNADQGIKAEGAFKSLLKWDLNYLVKNPMFFLYGLFSSLALPLIMLFPIYMISVNSASRGSDSIDIFGMIRSFSQTENGLWVALVFVLITVFISISNTVITCAFSMEGKYFYIKKLLPIKSSWFLWSKFIIGYVFSLVSILLMAGITGFLGLGIFDIINFTLISALYVSILVQLIIFLDSIRPNLKWTTPKQCMNKNLNSFLAMLLSGLFMMMLFIIGGISYLIVSSLGLPLGMIYISFYLFGLILLIGVIFLIKKVSQKTISRIEV